MKSIRSDYKSFFYLWYSCETNNLIFKYPDVVKLLDQTLELYRQSARPPVGWGHGLEERADPKYFNYTWTNFLDYYERLPSDPVERTGYPPVIITEKDISNAIPGWQDLIFGR